MRRLHRPRRRDEHVLGLFAQAGANAERASHMLRDLLADFPDRSELAAELVKAEQHGDRLAHDIFHRLDSQSGGAPPFESADVHALASAIDDIVDYAEEAADSLGLYGIEAPMEQAIALADVLVAASGQVAQALGALPDGELEPHLRQIHRLENDGDRLRRAGVAALFQAGIDPMVVIRWKDIFEVLEDAIDACETVAHQLEGIVLKLSSGRGH